MICALIPLIDRNAEEACEILKSQKCDVIAIGGNDSCRRAENSCVSCVADESSDRWSMWSHGIDIAAGLGYTEYVLIADHCIPQNGIVESHGKYLSAGYPMITIGRCLSRKNLWRDHRSELIGKDSRVVSNVSLVTSGMISCGNIGLNSGAVCRLKALNHAAISSDSVFPIHSYGHRIGYAAWAMHIVMGFLPFGQNAVKQSDGYSYDPIVKNDDGYVESIRNTPITLDLLGRVG